MGEILGKIQILEDKIITTKENIVETWAKYAGDETKFIVYKNIRYKLLKVKEISN